MSLNQPLHLQDSTFTGRSLTGDNMEHLREGHRPRSGTPDLQPAETEGV